MEASPAVAAPGRRLGKKPPKFDPRTLRLAHYIEKRKLPRVPKSHNLSRKTARALVAQGRDWGMMLNDQYGCCTRAALGHMHQTWSVYGGMLWVPTDAAILEAYDRINGGKDEGAAMLDALNDARHNGTGMNKIFAYAAVNPTNRDQVTTAHLLFGGLYVGAMLPENAQEQSVWDLKDGNGSEPGSWGGHAMNIVDYTTKGVTFVTWGALQQATWAWVERYCDEMYAVLEEDYVGEDRRSPQGLSLERLRKDLLAL